MATDSNNMATDNNTNGYGDVAGMHMYIHDSVREQA